MAPTVEMFGIVLCCPLIGGLLPVFDRTAGVAHRQARHGFDQKLHITVEEPGGNLRCPEQQPYPRTVQHRGCESLLNLRILLQDSGLTDATRGFTRRVTTIPQQTGGSQMPGVLEQGVAVYLGQRLGSLSLHHRDCATQPKIPVYRTLIPRVGTVDLFRLERRHSPNIRPGYDSSG